jgi:hypothetical protein
VPPLLYEAANDAMSKVPPAGVSLTEETTSCDTCEAVEAVEVMVVLVAVNELMFTLDNFEVPTWESSVSTGMADERDETILVWATLEKEP